MTGPSRTIRAAAGAVPSAAMALAPAAAPAQHPPTLTDLGLLPGATRSVARAVSADGTAVVGWSGTPERRRAFRWTPLTGMQDLGAVPGHTASEALAVSGDGSVVVGESRGTHDTRAFRWSATLGMQDLGVLPGDVGACATGVGGDGDVVVGTSVADGGGTNFRAFRWTPQGGMRPLFQAGLPTLAEAVTTDGSVVLGWWSDFHSGWGGFRWTLAGGPEFFSGLTPRAISADGAVVAGTESVCSQKRGCWSVATLWTVESGAEPLYLGVADALSGDGRAVCGSAYRGSPPRPSAVLWTRERGAVDLNDHLPTLGLNLDGWRLEHAGGLSHDARAIAGTGSLGGAGRAWLVVLPPPPCSADCDSSTGPGVLDAFDFLCFQNRFAAGAPYACDCDTSTGPGACDVLDFLCFQNAFSEGCP